MQLTLWAFNVFTPSAKPTPTSTTTTATTAAPTPAANTDDITWQELENKINTWNNEIEQQATVFLKQVIDFVFFRLIWELRFFCLSLMKFLSDSS